MTQALHAKQGHRAQYQAGWILDYWVASLIAATERTIRRRCARQLVRMQVADTTPAASMRSIANGKPS